MSVERRGIVVNRIMCASSIVKVAVERNELTIGGDAYGDKT